MNPTPQLFKPAIEQWANKDFFRGRPIVGQGLDRLLPEAQAMASTGEFARIVGKTTGLSPVRLESAVRGYLGTAGLYVLDVADVAGARCPGRADKAGDAYR